MSVGTNENMRLKKKRTLSSLKAASLKQQFVQEWWADSTFQGQGRESGASSHLVSILQVNQRSHPLVTSSSNDITSSQVTSVLNGYSKETLNITNTVHLRGTLIKKGKKVSQAQCLLIGMWRPPKEILIR